MADVVNLAARRAERRREDDERLGQKVVDRAAHLREAGEGGDVDDDDVPNGWASGAAKCMNCSHEWVPVAPAGTVFLACPACDCEQGRWQYPFEPQEGTVVYACTTCGAHEFYVVAAGATEDDLPLLETSGGASHEHYLFCAGCGESKRF